MKIKKWSTYLFAIVFFVMILVVIVQGFQTSDTAEQAKEYKQVEAVIQKSISECYAMEGRYPKDFEYLKKHYQIHINSKRYKVYYQYQGENMIPIVDIIEKE
ncbi:MAG: hypothetical protein RSF69_07585 [Erysipelotrichaceae bacterium]